jgi:hypothetical protein
MIHSLGAKFVPVDESSNCSTASWNKHVIEGIPSYALRRWDGFSTRLFDWF